MDGQKSPLLLQLFTIIHHIQSNTYNQAYLQALRNAPSIAATHTNSAIKPSEHSEQHEHKGSPKVDNIEHNVELDLIALPFQQHNYLLWSYLSTYIEEAIVSLYPLHDTNHRVRNGENGTESGSKSGSKNKTTTFSQNSSNNAILDINNAKDEFDNLLDDANNTNKQESSDSVITLPVIFPVLKNQIQNLSTNGIDQNNDKKLHISFLTIDTLKVYAQLFHQLLISTTSSRGIVCCIMTPGDINKLTNGDQYCNSNLMLTSSSIQEYLLTAVAQYNTTVSTGLSLLLSQGKHNSPQLQLQNNENNENNANNDQNGTNTNHLDNTTVTLRTLLSQGDIVFTPLSMVNQLMYKNHQQGKETTSSLPSASPPSSSSASPSSPHGIATYLHTIAPSFPLQRLLVITPTYSPVTRKPCQSTIAITGYIRPVDLIGVNSPTIKSPQKSFFFSNRSAQFKSNPIIHTTLDRSYRKRIAFIRPFTEVLNAQTASVDLTEILVKFQQDHQWFDVSLSQLPKSLQPVSSKDSIAPPIPLELEGIIKYQEGQKDESQKSSQNNTSRSITPYSTPEQQQLQQSTTPTPPQTSIHRSDMIMSKFQQQQLVKYHQENIKHETNYVQVKEHIGQLLLNSDLLSPTEHQAANPPPQTTSINTLKQAGVLLNNQLSQQQQQHLLSSQVFRQHQQHYPLNLGQYFMNLLAKTHHDSYKQTNYLEYHHSYRRSRILSFTRPTLTLSLLHRTSTQQELVTQALLTNNTNNSTSAPPTNSPPSSQPTPPPPASPNLQPLTAPISPVTTSNLSTGGTTNRLLTSVHHALTALNLLPPVQYLNNIPIQRLSSNLSHPNSQKRLIGNMGNADVMQNDHSGNHEILHSILNLNIPIPGSNNNDKEWVSGGYGSSNGGVINNKDNQSNSLVNSSKQFSENKNFVRFFRTDANDLCFASANTFPDSDLLFNTISLTNYLRQSESYCPFNSITRSNTHSKITSIATFLHQNLPRGKSDRQFSSNTLFTQNCLCGYFFANIPSQNSSTTSPFNSTTFTLPPLTSIHYTSNQSLLPHFDDVSVSDAQTRPTSSSSSSLCPCKILQQFLHTKILSPSTSPSYDNVSSLDKFLSLFSPHLPLSIEHLALIEQPYFYRPSKPVLLSPLFNYEIESLSNLEYNTINSSSKQIVIGSSLVVNPISQMLSLNYSHFSRPNILSNVEIDPFTFNPLFFIRNQPHESKLDHKYNPKLTQKGLSQTELFKLELEHDWSKINHHLSPFIINGFPHQQFIQQPNMGGISGLHPISNLIG